MELKLAYSKKCDEDLWNDFRNGDRDAFSMIYYRQIQSLLNYGHKFTHEQEVIEDCVQELFYDLWKKGAENPEVNSIKAYLFTSLRNRILKKLNKEQKFFSLTGSEFNIHFQLSIENEMIMDESKREMKNRLEKCLQELPPLQKEIIFLKFYADFSIDEISQMLQLNKKSIYNALSKAMISFRKNLSLVPVLSFLIRIISQSIR